MKSPRDSYLDGGSEKNYETSKRIEKIRFSVVQKDFSDEKCD